MSRRLLYPAILVASLSCLLDGAMLPDPIAFGGRTAPAPKPSDSAPPPSKPQSSSSTDSAGILPPDYGNLPVVEQVRYGKGYISFSWLDAPKRTLPAYVLPTGQTVVPVSITQEYDDSWGDPVPYTINRLLILTPQGIVVSPLILKYKNIGYSQTRTPCRLERSLCFPALAKEDFSFLASEGIPAFSSESLREAKIVVNQFQ